MQRTVSSETYFIHIKHLNTIIESYHLIRFYYYDNHLFYFLLFLQQFVLLFLVLGKEIDNKDIGLLNYNIFTKELSEDSIKTLEDLGYDINDIEINLL